MSETGITAEKEKEKELPQERPRESRPDVGKIKRKRRRKKLIKRIIGIIIALAICGGIVFFMINLFREETVEQVPQTAWVTRGSIVSAVNGGGVARPRDVASISPPSGEVLEVFTSEGEWVNEGDPLFRIDSGDLDENVDTARERVNDLTRQIANERAKYDDLVIRAPFAGTLEETTRFEPGDFVGAGTPIAVLNEVSTLKLELYYVSTYEGEIRPGMRVRVSIPSMMASVDGTVREVNQNVRRPTPEGSMLFLVVIELSNPGTLSAGMTANATITTSSGEQILPYEAAALQYNRSVTIATRASGDVISANLIDYMNVSSGQLLLTLSEDTIGETIENLQRQLNDAQEALQKAQEGFDRYYAVAPISGTVVSFPLTMGQVIETASGGGSAPTVMIQDISTMFIDINIDEINVANVRPGMFVSLSNFMGTDFFFGVVDSVNSQGNNEMGITLYPAVISVDNADGRIMPYMSMEYNLVAAQSDDCLVIPISAVKYTMAGMCVFVRADAPPDNSFDADELGIDIPEGFYAVPVVIGLTDNSQAEVVSGLEDGMEVFIRYGAGGEEDMSGGGMRGGVIRLG